MKLIEIDTYLNNKMNENPELIVFTFYELRIKLNLTEEETLVFLHLVKTKLENNNYKVYKTGEEYFFKGKNIKVKDNELLVAVEQ